MSSFLEFFTLAQARVASGRASAGTRKATAEALAMVKQRGEAAEALWSAGHSAEALRLAVDAHACGEEAARAWLEDERSEAPAAPAETPKDVTAEPSADATDMTAEPSADATAEPSADATAQSSGDATTEPSANAAGEEKPSPSPSAVARVFRAQGALSIAERAEKVEKLLKETTAPRVDAQVGRPQTELFDELADLRTSLERGLGEVLLTPRDLKFRSAARILTASTLLVGGALGTYFATRTPVGEHARASATYNDAPDFEPSRAIDGNVDTSWLLPDRVNGWVEVTINPPRAVQRVRIMNTTNVPYHDRATSDYQLQLFSGSRVLQSADGTFPETSAPQWVTHDVGNTEAVDRVRITVNSWLQHGGGIAERAIE